MHMEHTILRNSLLKALLLPKELSLNFTVGRFLFPMLFLSGVSLRIINFFLTCAYT